MALRDFYVAWANTNIKYSIDLWVFYEENLDAYGIQDGELVEKLKFVFKEFEQAPMYFKEGIKHIESGGTIETMDECIKHLSALPIGSVQSYVPNLVSMTARLCERDFGCNFDNLVQSGMAGMNALDILYGELSGTPAMIPPFPVIPYTFTDNVLSMLYETDIMWLLDSLRMIPEIEMKCMMDLKKSRGATMEDMQKLMMYVAEISPQLLIEYGNVSNFLANRPHHQIPHDWGVLSLSILQSDLEIYADDSFFFNAVDSSILPMMSTDIFMECLRGEVKIGWKLIEKLKKVLG